MQIVNKETLAITTVQQLRLELKNVSIPKNPTPVQLDKLGYAPLEPEPAQGGDKVTRLPKAEKREDGKYYPTYQTASFTDEELAANARVQRDQLLRETDWITLRSLDTGVAAPPAWIDYRQALRDISNQPGFPGDIQWPEIPADLATEQVTP